MMLVRVRLRFQSTPVHYAQKCWFTFDKEQCRLVGDVAHLIGSQFGFDLHRDGIQLFMDDFLVPTNENADVFRDNDLIEVKSVSVRNGLIESSSSSDSSLSEAQPPARKKPRITPNKTAPRTTPIIRNKTAPRTTPNKAPTPIKTAPRIIPNKTAPRITPIIPNKAPTPIKTAPRITPIKTAPRITPNKTIPSTPASKGDANKSNKTISNNSKLQNAVKEFHVSEKKTASGGIHLTFNSSSNSESSSSEDERPVQSITTTNQNIPTPPMKLVESSASTRRGRRGKGRGGRQRGGRALPANVVIGGPSDAHTTLNTVYTNKDASIEDASLDNNSTANQMSTGWDVRPNEEPPVIIEPTRDYSNCPDLEGAPRVGDQLAFKLLELSGSCTPEVSLYKLASVMAYDHTAKTVTVRYQGPSNTIPDNASSRLAQFALEQEVMMECPQVVLELNSLITPKLVNT